jgi:hypothetical protein
VTSQQILIATGSRQLGTELLFGEDTDTVLAGPPKADDLTSLVSRSPVVPLPRSVRTEKDPVPTSSARFTEFLHGAAGDHS